MPFSILQMLVRLGDFLALHQLAPDREELVGHLVAFVVIEEDAVALEFDGVAACDDIDEHAGRSTGVERRGHARGEGRLSQARPHRDEEAQPPGERDHRRGDHPGIFARAARRKQHAEIAELVGGAAQSATDSRARRGARRSRCRDNGRRHASAGTRERRSVSAAGGRSSASVMLLVLQLLFRGVNVATAFAKSRQPRAMWRLRSRRDAAG